jgi:ribosome maturation factor RimP
MGQCAHFLFMQTEKFTKLISPAVTAMGYELWGYEFHPHMGRSLLRIYIEKDGGITLEDCERVSRQISALLDVEELIPGAFDLEISSPGLDRPLFKAQQYQRYIGKEVRIRTRVPINERRNYKGVLKTVSDETITVEGDGQVWVLPIADIEKANLVP